MNREAGKIVTKALKLYGELFAQRQGILALQEWAQGSDLPKALRDSFDAQLGAAAEGVKEAADAVYALMEKLRVA